MHVTTGTVAPVDHRRRRRIRRFLAVATVLAVSAAGCDTRTDITISGRTMGTEYHVKAVARRSADPVRLKTIIDRRLDDINRSMSTYRNDSDISRFNTTLRSDEPVAVSQDMIAVMTEARRIYDLTGGAWDGTVTPLVRLWGFFGDTEIREVPEPAAVTAILPKIGFDRITIRSDGFLLKQQADVTLDLSSIAKGYAVDEIAGLLRAQGIADGLVEIGGEVVAFGRKQDGSPWRVGINTPLKAASTTSVYRAVSLTDAAMATSGNYRQFFEFDGKTYSHILDPRTGYPVDNRVASVTVIADSCTLADGLATALMVMGPEEGIPLVERLHGVEGLFILVGENGTLVDRPSSGFPNI